MKIKPVNTLPLRLRLKFAGRNALIEKFTPWLDRFFARYADRLDSSEVGESYLELEIHPYALVGHQVASWAHGYLWARDLGLAYLGGDLTRDRDGFFNFKSLAATRPKAKPKSVRLLWVSDERDPRSLRILRGQVARARHKHPNRVLVFKLALDPARWDQVPAEEVVREAVLRGYKGGELLKAEQASDYVAIHIRRGADIHENHVSGKEAVNRWVLEEWHVAIVEALRALPSLAGKEVRVYALGQPEDFPLLARAGVTLRLNGDRDTDLVELAAARMLILSPSSFSFTAALISRSVILGRVPWWHFIPNTGRWVTIDADGKFDSERLESQMALGQ